MKNRQLIPPRGFKIVSLKICSPVRLISSKVRLSVWQCVKVQSVLPLRDGGFQDVFLRGLADVVQRLSVTQRNLELNLEILPRGRKKHTKREPSFCEKI